jgi:acyl carrier protein
MQTRSSTLDGVIATIVETLGIAERADTLNTDTPLFGSMPELDSLAVVELLTALEERFGFYIEDDEFTGEVFETIGSLASFVDSKRDQGAE